MFLVGYALQVIVSSYLLVFVGASPFLLYLCALSLLLGFLSDFISGDYQNVSVPALHRARLLLVQQGSPVVSAPGILANGLAIVPVTSVRAALSLGNVVPICHASCLNLTLIYYQ